MDSLPEWANNSWILSIALSSGTALLLGAFAKFFPKKKLATMVKKPCIGLGRMISKFMILRLGSKAAQRVEEGIVLTLLEVAGKGLLFIAQGLKEDNVRRVKK